MEWSKFKWYCTPGVLRRQRCEPRHTVWSAETKKKSVVFWCSQGFAHHKWNGTNEAVVYVPGTILLHWNSEHGTLNHTEYFSVVEKNTRVENKIKIVIIQHST